MLFKDEHCIAEKTPMPRALEVEKLPTQDCSDGQGSHARARIAPI